MVQRLFQFSACHHKKIALGLPNKFLGKSCHDMEMSAALLSMLNNLLL